MRTIESHTQSGNRTVDKQSLQRCGSDGNFEPYQDIEKESVKVNAATVRPLPAHLAEIPAGHKHWSK
jgi:hypothetical protein